MFTVLFLMAASKSFDKDPSESLDIYYGLLRATDACLAKPVEHAQTESKDYRARDTLLIEAVELFGLMPAKDNYVAKYILLTHEICRVHMFTRKEEKNAVVFLQTDFRNAQKMILSMVRRFPKNPYVLSKAGKFYLEIGNRAEANIYFGKVRAMLQELTKKTQTKSEGLTLENVLGQQPGPANELQKILLMLVSMNDGLVFMFEGKPQEAQGAFKYIMQYRPSNLVAANNMATANM